MGEKRIVLGGSWKDPNYMGFNAEAFNPFLREDNFGFRCIQDIYEEAVSTRILDPLPEPPVLDLRQLRPCSDEAFSVIRSFFSYEKNDLEPAIEFRRELSDYAGLEKVSFWDAQKKYRIVAYIFLPRKFNPPYQAVLFYPGSGAWYLDSFFDYPNEIESELYNKNGRAFVFPVFQGSFERRKEYPPRPWAPQIRRELRVRRFLELARCIDYLETRPADFQAAKIAYHGLSAGATMAPLYGALERRIKAIIAIGGGMSTTRDLPPPYQPEMDILNFYPRVKTPFLLINGKYDYYAPLETNLKVFMELLGTPKDDKYLMLYETGHIAYDPRAFREILDFLNKYLGPVK